jgi:biuret amidohydrolase
VSSATSRSSHDARERITDVSSTIAHSTPYAWPYDGAIDLRRLALVVITTVGGAPTDAAQPDRRVEAAWARVSELVEAVDSVGGVVLRVGTTPPNGPHRQGGGGPEAGAAASDTASAACDVQAHGVDGFFASSLDAVLRARGLDQLVLCGQWLETSVHSTMRSANDRGYECLLVLDACVPFDSDLVPAARSQVEMSGGIFGAVGATDDVLAALTTLTRHPAATAAKERTSR